MGAKSQIVFFNGRAGSAIAGNVSERRVIPGGKYTFGYGVGGTNFGTGANRSEMLLRLHDFVGDDDLIFTIYDSPRLDGMVNGNAQFLEIPPGTYDVLIDNKRPDVTYTAALIPHNAD